LLPLLGFVSEVAHAQADPAAIKRGNDCRLAGQVIETGHPAPQREWAWKYIGFCEPAQRVDAYLAAMEQSRRSADIPFVRRSILSAVAIRDGALFEKVFSIAGDKSSSIPARVVAFMALASIRNPGVSPTYRGFIGGLDEYGIPRGECSRRLAHAIEPTQGPTPLPSDFRQRIEAVRELVRRDTTEAADVRSAAACT
jgi:hypothetical protein